MTAVALPALHMGCDSDLGLDVVADETVNPALTEALWAWLSEDDRLDRFAADCLEDDDNLIEPQILADWAEDAIREDVGDPCTAMVLLQACRLSDWRELTGRTEESLEI